MPRAHRLPTIRQMFVTAARQTNAPTTFSKLHKQYVQNLYRRFLRNSLDWHIRRDLWRADAQRIRAEFEHNRNVKNPRELATILQQAEQQLASRQHPDPYKRTLLCMLTQPRPTWVVPSGMSALTAQLMSRERNLPVRCGRPLTAAAHVHGRGKDGVAEGPARVESSSQPIHSTDTAVVARRRPPRLVERAGVLPRGVVASEALPTRRASACTP